MPALDQRRSLFHRRANAVPLRGLLRQQVGLQRGEILRHHRGRHSARGRGQRIAIERAQFGLRGAARRPAFERRQQQRRHRYTNPPSDAHSCQHPLCPKITARISASDPVSSVHRPLLVYYLEQLVQRWQSGSRASRQTRCRLGCDLLLRIDSEGGDSDAFHNHCRKRNLRATCVVDQGARRPSALHASAALLRRVQLLCSFLIASALDSRLKRTQAQTNPALPSTPRIHKHVHPHKKPRRRSRQRLSRLLRLRPCCLRPRIGPPMTSRRRDPSFMTAMACSSSPPIQAWSRS